MEVKLEHHKTRSEDKKRNKVVQIMLWSALNTQKGRVIEKGKGRYQKKIQGKQENVLEGGE